MDYDNLQHTARLADQQCRGLVRNNLENECIYLT